MTRLLFIFLTITTTLLARYDAKPVKACEAYNNMKHTKNTHNVVLDLSREYTVLKQHKEQKLILVRGEQPAQRWVDGECFGEKNTHKYEKRAETNTNKYKKPISQPSKSDLRSLLVLSWHNAFCETNRNRRECRSRANEHHLVLHGLWPQPRNNIYCKVTEREKSNDKYHRWRALPKPDLSPRTSQLLKHYMPGEQSNLDRHEWIKHGTCYSESAERYYHDALAMTQQVNMSAVGKLLGANMGRRITIQQVRQAFDRSFGKGAGRRVSLKCRSGLVTEIWISLAGKGDDLRELIGQGRTARSSCRVGIIDRPGFGR